jgi:hypothetical protein
VSTAGKRAAELLVSSLADELLVSSLSDERRRVVLLVSSLLAVGST